MSRRRKLIYALFTVLLLFGAAEAGLRLAGFRYQRVTTYLEFNYPRPGFLKAFFEIDPDLLYRIRPTVKQRWVDLTWQPAFDLKIRDHRRFGPPAPGSVRVIALGDSSTYGVNTRVPWPTRLQARLDRAARPAEVLNLGVPGYTAFQGRRVLETRGERLAPDWLVLYFGWNDHLLALGYTDAEQKIGSPGVVAVRNLLASSRVYQAVSWAVAGLRGPPESHGKRRVGPEAFEADLRAMVERARALGTGAVLCTYPTALRYLAATEAEPPAWLLETHLESGDGEVSDLLRLQDTYNDIVRQVAADTGSPLADLDAAFRARDAGSLFADPSADMIHPNEAGYDLTAALVEQALESAGAFAPDRRPR